MLKVLTRALRVDFDAYLNYKFMDEVQLLVGQTKARNTRSYLISDGALMFVDRAPYIGNFSHGYDIGAMLHGKIAKGLVEYSIEGSNGDGQTNTSSDNDNMFSTRVVVNPFGTMSTTNLILREAQSRFFPSGPTLSTIPSLMHLPQAMPRRFHQLAIQRMNSTTMALIPVQVDGCVCDGRGDFVQFQNNASNVTQCAVGYLGQVGYMVTPELGLAVRYSVYDPDRAKSGDMQTEQIGAVSYYFNKHNLKLQADVGNLHSQHGAAPSQDDMQYRVQAQIIF